MWNELENVYANEVENCKKEKINKKQIGNQIKVIWEVMAKCEIWHSVSLHLNIHHEFVQHIERNTHLSIINESIYYFIHFWSSIRSREDKNRSCSSSVYVYPFAFLWTITIDSETGANKTRASLRSKSF